MGRFKKLFKYQDMRRLLPLLLLPYYILKTVILLEIFVNINSPILCNGYTCRLIIDVGVGYNSVE